MTHDIAKAYISFEEQLTISRDTIIKIIPPPVPIIPFKIPPQKERKNAVNIMTKLFISI